MSPDQRITLTANAAATPLTHQSPVFSRSQRKQHYISDQHSTRALQQCLQVFSTDFMPVHATSHLKRQAQLLQRHLPQRTSNTTASILRRPSLSQAVPLQKLLLNQDFFGHALRLHPHPSVPPAAQSNEKSIHDMLIHNCINPACQAVGSTASTDPHLHQRQWDQ